MTIKKITYEEMSPMNKRFKTSLLAASVGVASLSAGSVFAAGFQLNEHSVSAMGRANAGAASHADNAAILARNPAASTSFDSVELSIALHAINPDVDVEGTNRFTAAGVKIIGGGAYSATFAPIYGGAGGDLNNLPGYLAEAAQGQTPTFLSAADGVAFGTAAADPAPTTAQTQAEGYASTVVADASATDIAPNALVPGFYVAIPVTEKLAFGVSANSYFGLSSDYGNVYSASEHAGETSIETYYLTPSVAYKITDSISIGLGLQYIYGKGLIHSFSSSVLGDPIVGVVPEGETLLKLDGDGDAFGYQLGLMWDINGSSSIGFRYQSEVDLDFEGDIELYNASKQGADLGKGILTANLPAVAEVGYSNQVSESWTIHGSVLYTGWSSFENLTAKIEKGGDFTADQEKLLKEENWEDAYTFSIGADYALNEITTVRAGITYDESPVQDEYRTLTIPDADRMWYSMGATIKVGDGGSIDASLLYIDGKSASVNEEFKTTVPGQGEVALTEFEGELGSVSATIFSLGYNHKF